LPARAGKQPMQWVQRISGQVKKLKQQDARVVQLAAVAPRALRKLSL
jgi:hypothetical protein